MFSINMQRNPNSKQISWLIGKSVGLSQKLHRKVDPLINEKMRDARGLLVERSFTDVMNDFYQIMD